MLMRKKKELRIGKSLVDFFMLFSNLLDVVPSLASKKIKVIRENIIAIILFSLIMAIFLASIWFSVVALLYLYFVSLGSSPAVSVFILFCINLLLTILIGFAITKHQKNLSFQSLFEKCQELI